jgi:hypothetical protein
MLPYITFQATNQRRAAKHEGITIGIKKSPSMMQYQMLLDVHKTKKLLILI